MPDLRVRNVKSDGAKATVKPEALTIKEHGGEQWQSAGQQRLDTADLPPNQESGR